MLTGCLPGDGSYTPSKPAGFLSGIWHGWIAPISLIVELFNRNIRVYEPVNTGLWYDIGYCLAVSGGFGSLSFSLVRKRRYGNGER
ncbi:MAG: hypothetical protein IMW97_04600 [Firmicutes bacterium]|nr:hypothetical protein [Candidatus Fermentithermobacillaceae bacterium]